MQVCLQACNDTYCSVLLPTHMAADTIAVAADYAAFQLMLPTTTCGRLGVVTLFSNGQGG